jgi:F420-non-reducing hydrogenase iron-sulfur subunit
MAYGNRIPYINALSDHKINIELGVQSVNKKALKIYIFYCSADAAVAERIKSYSEDKSELKAIPLPCSGKIDIPYFTKAFETGADGVAVVICKQSECQFLEGNLRAIKRAAAVGTLLDEAGMGKGRVAVIQANDGDDQVIKEIKDFQVKIKAFPN